MNDGQRPNASFDSAFRATMHTALEVILNLSYLTKIEAEYPEKVRAHMEVIEQRIGDLRRFMGVPVDRPQRDDTSKGRGIPPRGD
jgi:hypothetical protein